MTKEIRRADEAARRWDEERRDRQAARLKRWSEEHKDLREGLREERGEDEA